MPIPPQFRSQNELVIYLEDLEKRVATLEAENMELKENRQTPPEIDVSDQVNELLDKRFLKTKLFSPNFLTRAFTIWAYYFTAQLIILAGILIVVLIGRTILLAGGH